MDPICPIDMSGRFVDPVTEFKGQHVKVQKREGIVLAYSKLFCVVLVDLSKTLFDVYILDKVDIVLCTNQRIVLI